jgi:hypothetical protein
MQMLAYTMAIRMQPEEKKPGVVDLKDITTCPKTTEMLGEFDKHYDKVGELYGNEREMRNESWTKGELRLRNAYRRMFGSEPE